MTGPKVGGSKVEGGGAASGDAMMATDGGGLEPFTFAIFSGLAGVRHGITRRAPGLHRDGDLSFVTGGAGAAVFASRRAWVGRIGGNAGRVVAARQVHGAAVARVTAADRGRGARAIAEAIPDTDALVTDAPDTPLLLCFADCAPILFHDPVRGVVGLAHAGWRGTVADVAGATVRALGEHFGSRPADIRAGIGPAIGPCCYVVGRDVIDGWAALDVAEGAELGRVVRPMAGSAGQWYFDLPLANRLLLERAGLRPEHIEDAGACTACNVEHFFSHRAERGQTGRFAAIIQLTSDEPA